MGSNEYRSDTQPIRNVEMMVPTPAPAPPMPLTVATDWLGYRSAGSASPIVDHAEYENVAMANSPTIAKYDDTSTEGISSVMPSPQISTTAFRAASTAQPR